MIALAGTTSARDRIFRHEALPYLGADQFLPTAASAVREGLENDERTIVLASTARLDDLQDALGADGDDVTFVASDRHARNPARVAMILENFCPRGSGDDDQPALGINDSAPGRSAAASVETRFSDALLNVLALRSWSLSLLCLFDTSAVDDVARYSIRQGHGVVRGSDTNIDFDPDLAVALYAAALEPAPPDAARLTVTTGGLARARAFVRREVAAHDLPGDRLADLVLAVNEIVTNSLRYGGGRAELAVWTQDGAACCEVRDHGFLADPLTGRFAPPPAAPSGRGVWLAHNLCDLVQLRSSPGGTVVRMHVEA